MGKTYTSTIKVQCWKEHTCVGCGSSYAYELIRTVRGQAPSAEQASINARAAAQRAMDRDVDMQPCPACGLFQPDMIGQTRARLHKLVFWLTLPALILILVLRAADVLQAYTATWAAAGVCAAAALALWAIDLRDPNRDPAGNRELAAGRVAGGQVRHQPAAAPLTAEQLSVAARAPSHRAPLLLALAAVALVVMPEVLRSQQHWPLNEDSYPPVAGPGDEARVYMTEKVSSIKGYWRGAPHVVAHEPGADARVLDLNATTNQKDWGSSISAKSREKSNSSTPWVRVALPADPDLAGKTLQCDIDLAVEYPQATGSSSFERRSANLHRSVTLHLASPGAAGRYNKWWWWGTLAGAGLVLVCAQVLVGAARALQRRAQPTRVFT